MNKLETARLLATCLFTMVLVNCAHEQDKLSASGTAVRTVASDPATLQSFECTTDRQNVLINFTWTGSGFEVAGVINGKRINTTIAAIQFNTQIVNDTVPTQPSFTFTGTAANGDRFTGALEGQGSSLTIAGQDNFSAGTAQIVCSYTH